jgi:hypothetical protein
MSGGLVVRKDSLLMHCLARVVVGDEGGMEAAAAKYGARAERMSKWDGLRLGVAATPKASRVAGFILFWAVAMRTEGKDEYSITEYQRFWCEGERRAYRLQAEFRELWPEFETPNELARQLVKHIDAKLSKREMMALPARLQVSV